MPTKADIALNDIKHILKREYHHGTTVTNCVVHMHKPITQRPDDCNLCQTDIRNTLSTAIRMNEWLNEWKDDMTDAWYRFSTQVLVDLGVIKDA